jgi:hypothetical protein
MHRVFIVCPLPEVSERLRIRDQSITSPPSTFIDWPVALAAVARYSTAAAISSGVLSLLSGISALLAVGNRRAPEHLHPTPVEDCYAGLAWLAAHTGELGIDPTMPAISRCRPGPGSIRASVRVCT